jgi:hypothetical protein
MALYTQVLGEVPKSSRSKDAVPCSYLSFQQQVQKASQQSTSSFASQFLKRSGASRTQASSKIGSTERHNFATAEQKQFKSKGFLVSSKVIHAKQSSTVSIKNQGDFKVKIIGKTSPEPKEGD